MAMDDVTLSNIRTRFAALPPGSVVDGQWWDVRDHGLALLAEIDRLRATALLSEILHTPVKVKDGSLELTGDQVDYLKSLATVPTEDVGLWWMGVPVRRIDDTPGPVPHPTDTVS